MLPMSLSFPRPAKVCWAFPNTRETYESHFSPWRHCRRWFLCSFGVKLPYLEPYHLDSEGSWDVVGFPELNLNIPSGSLNFSCSKKLRNSSVHSRSEHIRIWQNNNCPVFFVVKTAFVLWGISQMLNLWPIYLHYPGGPSAKKRSRWVKLG